jgi:hypothetical protein
MQVTAQTSLQEEERKGLAHIDGQAPRRIGPDAVESGAGPLISSYQAAVTTPLWQFAAQAEKSRPGQVQLFSHHTLSTSTLTSTKKHLHQLKPPTHNHQNGRSRRRCPPEWHRQVVQRREGIRLHHPRERFRRPVRPLPRHRGMLHIHFLLHCKYILLTPTTEGRLQVP